MKNYNSFFLSLFIALICVFQLFGQSDLVTHTTSNGNSAQNATNFTTPGAPIGLTLTQGDNGSQAAASQFFPDFDAIGEAADDFIIPAGCPRTIVSVDIGGSNSVDPFNPNGFIMNIYADANGSVGSLLFSETFTGITTPSFTLSSTTCPPMAAGVYWISIVADMDFNPNGQWFWGTSFDEIGNTPFQWQNPDGIFGNPCTSWGDGVADCGIGIAEEPNLNYVINLSEEIPAEGGTLAGGPYDFCVGDGAADFIPAGGVTVSGNVGTNSAYVITDDQGVILGLPAMFSDVNFDGTGEGTCLLWHLSYEDDLTGATIGANAADLGGCFALSNPVEVNRTICPDPAIPTMGEWGLISLTILLAIFGIVAIKEKQLVLE